MKRSAPLLLTLAATLTGCMAFPTANTPKRGAVPTGEPLAVIEDVKVWTTKYKEKVGEAVHRDANGNKVGTTDVYSDRTQVHSRKVWYLAQGPERIDDEDYFRIAGDQASLEETQRVRAKAKRRIRNGRITLVAGLVSMIGGLFVPQPKLKTLFVLGGTGAMTVGWYFTYSGARVMNPEYHAVDRSVAERAARDYNQRIQTAGNDDKTVGVGYFRKF